MSEIAYMKKARELLDRIEATQNESIQAAAKLMAASIANEGLVHVFGSGHSVIPVLDIFPRYGSFVGFHPLLDPRLMWTDVLGRGGARGLLWLERREGYITSFLESFSFKDKDVMLVYSHGGLNAAPVETAAYAKDRGLSVVAVTSLENHKRASATHSSGKKLGDLADVLIDNCVPLEDAMVYLDGQPEPVGAGSTLAVIAITMSLVVEVARYLRERGHKFLTFVSPNVIDVDADHNATVFREYAEALRKH
jgi:uncharacterized phosphosugar-binding protein